MDIFLSYASEDRERIIPIVHALEAKGWSVFWDRKTPVGMTWEDFIEKELRQATCVLAVWSEISTNKRWVRMEARQGQKRGCFVPLRIDPVDPPFGFDDVQSADLTGWSGGNNHHEWLGLIAAVERFSPRKTTAPLPKPATTETAPPNPADDTANHPQQAQEKQSPVDSNAEIKPTPVAPEQPAGTEATQSNTGSHTESNAEAHSSRLPTKGVMIGAVITFIAISSIAILQQNSPDSPSTKPIPVAPPAATVKSLPKSQKNMTAEFPLPELVSIPAGCFTMGSEKSEHKAEKPAHKVCLEPFQLSRHEITFEQYAAFAKATKRRLPGDIGWGRGDRPVINVNWQDAKAYTQWLSDQLGQTCDLPSEAQWEYAARAGTTTEYALPAPNGSDDIRDKGLANCGGCGGRWDDKDQTAPVGSFRPNDWGLYDMHGNVTEWVQDQWHDNYQVAPNDGSAWKNQSDSDALRVLRGGTWLGNPGGSRSAYRVRYDPDGRVSLVGFRVFCSGP